MANGPLGGFMPTPPSPGQPPQVKLETSAESRGAFNKFLGTLPRNGAVAPIQTGVVQSSTAPVSPMTSNVNIFEPQNFLSGGLVQFGRDLQRGLADPVNQKTKEIPQFLQVIEDADILSGWNSEGYDITYTTNRIIKVLGKSETRKLCLWDQFPKERT